MQEVLFRGMTMFKDEWVYGDLLHHGGHTLIGYINSGGEINCCKVYPNTVGQYTGIVDKCGKKIFEGDILTINGGDDHVYVKFSDFSWEYISRKYEYYKNRLNSEDSYIIIGNVFDNPELLPHSILDDDYSEFIGEDNQ